MAIGILEAVAALKMKHTVALAGKASAVKEKEEAMAAKAAAEEEAEASKRDALDMSSRIQQLQTENSQQDAEINRLRALVGEDEGEREENGTGVPMGAPMSRAEALKELEASKKHVEDLNMQLAGAQQALLEEKSAHAADSKKWSETEEALERECADLRERLESEMLVRQQSEDDLQEARRKVELVAGAVTGQPPRRSRGAGDARGQQTAAAATASSHASEEAWVPFHREAQSLEKSGRLADAEQLYAQVLSIRKEGEGDETVGVATASRDLARVLALQKKHVAAEKQYKLSVALCSRLLGEEHPSTACALTDLAAVLREQEKYDEAEANAARAVDSLRKGVGAKDVSTATALYNLAGLAKRQGKYGVAEKAYGEALEIFKERMGDGVGETADTLYQMGCLYRKRAEYRAAQDLFNQASTSYSKAFGPADKRVAEATRRAKTMAERLSRSQASARSRASADHA
jgi:tetratricopeptide (TPR) repeat protein